MTLIPSFPILSRLRWTQWSGKSGSNHHRLTFVCLSFLRVHDCPVPRSLEWRDALTPLAPFLMIISICCHGYRSIHFVRSLRDVSAIKPNNWVSRIPQAGLHRAVFSMQNTWTGRRPPFRFFSECHPTRSTFTIPLTFTACHGQVIHGTDIVRPPNLDCACASMLSFPSQPPLS
jgi:hypothetical protein